MAECRAPGTPTWLCLGERRRGEDVAAFVFPIQSQTRGYRTRLAFLAVLFFVPVRPVLLEGSQEYESSRRDLRSRVWIV